MNFKKKLDILDVGVPRQVALKVIGLTYMSRVKTNPKVFKPAKVRRSITQSMEGLSL